MMFSRPPAFCLVLAIGGCGGGGGFPSDAAIDSPPPGGKFSLSWSVTDPNGQPITCSQVGAQIVTLTLRDPGVLGSTIEVFGCTSAMATSPAISPGVYDITFELKGLAGVLATAPNQVGIEIKSAQTTALTPITFALEATGGLELLLASNQPDGNCAPAPTGAGITATTITLAHTGGACEPVTFEIAAGATQPAGTYTVNCAAPTLAPCIENDQKITVSNVPSGGYQVQIRGKVGANDCWTNNDAFQVPPLSQVLKQTLSLAQQPGC